MTRGVNAVILPVVIRDGDHRDHFATNGTLANHRAGVISHVESGFGMTCTMQVQNAVIMTAVCYNATAHRQHIKSFTGQWYQHSASSVAMPH
jgi:hypothetical protein